MHDADPRHPHAPRDGRHPAGGRAPDGVLPCGCTTDVVDALHTQAGVERPAERRNLWALVAAHLAPQSGEIAAVLHDAEPGPVWSDLLLFGGLPGATHFDLVTAGMSARPMRLPGPLRRRDAPRRAEVVLRLPAGPRGGAPAAAEAFERVGGWPLEWLAVLARLPHALGVAMGDSALLPAANRVLLAGRTPGCPFEGAVLARPSRFGRDVPLLRAVPPAPPLGSDAARFLSVVPCHRSELEFALDRGVDALLSRLRGAGIDDVVRMERRAVV